MYDVCFISNTNEIEYPNDALQFEHKNETTNKKRVMVP